MNKPPETITSRLSLIEKQINRAERDLIEQRTTLDGEDGMAVLFTGNHHDAFPRFLVTNGDLSPVEKLTWQVIRLSITDPHRPGATPRRDDLAVMINCSPATVTKCRNMLRVRRWITFIKQVRRQGRFVGDLYLLHDEPLSLQSTLELDGSYINFLEQQVQTASGVKRAAAEALREIEIMTTGLQPSETEVMGARLNRMIGANGQDDSNSRDFFWFGSDEDHHSKNLSPVDRATNDQNPEKPEELRGFEHQSKNLDAVKSHHSKNLSPVKKENFFSSGSSSSFNNNKYISLREHARDESAMPDSETAPTGQTSSLDDYREITAMGRWGGPYDETVWIKKHMPMLLSPALETYMTWLYAGRSNCLPAIFKQVQRLAPHDREMCLYQLLGRVAMETHGWAKDRLRDPIGYLAKLVSLQAERRLILDEWALELLRCVQEGKLATFMDAPRKLALRGEWEGDF